MTISVSPQEVTGLDLLLAAKQNKIKSSATVIVSSDGTLNVVGGASYSLPVASPTVLGGVKIGAGLAIDGSGILSATTGSAGGGQLISLADQTWHKILQPINYGTTYSNGTRQGRYFFGGYKINAGVNFKTQDRPDNVVDIFAYNIDKPNGGREFTNEAGANESFENHYDNSGFLPYGDFEWHKARIYDSRGYEHRMHSIYVNKTNGHARQDFEGDVFTFMRTRFDETVPQNPVTWGSLQEASLSLTATVDGRVTGFIGTNFYGTKIGVWDIGGVTFIEGGFVQGKGYGHNYINTPSFANDSLAKTTNEKLLAGEVYWRAITLPSGEVLDVITRVK